MARTKQTARPQMSSLPGGIQKLSKKQKKVLKARDRKEKARLIALMDYEIEQEKNKQLGVPPPDRDIVIEQGLLKTDCNLGPENKDLLDFRAQALLLVKSRGIVKPTEKEINSKVIAMMDCASLNALFRDHYNYDLGMTVSSNTLKKDNAPLFPYIEKGSKTNDDGSTQIAFKSVPIQPLNESPLNFHSAVAHPDLSKLSIDQIKPWVAKLRKAIFDVNSAWYVKYKSQLSFASDEKLYAAIASTGQNFSSIACGHYTSSGINHFGPVKIVNNGQFIDSDWGCPDLFSLTDFLIHEYHPDLFKEIDEGLQIRPRTESELQSLPLAFKECIHQLVIIIKNEAFTLYGNVEPAGIAYFKERNKDSNSYFVQNILVDRHDKAYTDSATSGCKDSGQSCAQGPLIGALNDLLLVRTLKDQLDRGFLSLNAILINTAISKRDLWDSKKFEIICNNAMAATGSDLMLFTNVPLAIYGQKNNGKITSIEGIAVLIPVMFHDWAKEAEDLDDEENNQDALTTTNQLMEQLKYLYYGLISHAKAQDAKVRVAKNLDDYDKHEKYMRQVKFSLEESHAKESTSPDMKHSLQRIHVHSTLNFTPEGQIYYSVQNEQPKWKHQKPSGAPDDFVLPPRPDPKGDPRVEDKYYYSKCTDIQRSRTLVHNGKLRFNSNVGGVERAATPLEEYINSCDGDIQQIYRLSQVIKSLKTNKKGIPDPLAYLKTFRKERFTVYMMVIDKRGSKFANATHAMQLIMSGGEQIRHVTLEPNVYAHILECFKVNAVKPDQSNAQTGAGMGRTFDYRTHVLANLTHAKKDLEHAGIKHSDFPPSIKQDIQKQNVPSANFIMGTENTKRVALAVALSTQNKEEPTTKNPLTVFLYYQMKLITQLVKQCANRDQIEALIDYEYLAKSNAKVPFVVGAPYQCVEPILTLSRKFMTLWFIHPLPLFLARNDYFFFWKNDFKPKINENCTVVVFQKSDCIQAKNLMKAVMKYMYGYLAQHDVYLTKDEFRCQAMQPHVVQNFLLYPVNVIWPDLDAVLTGIEDESLQYVNGFIKAQKKTNFSFDDPVQYRQTFKKQLIKITISAKGHFTHDNDQFESYTRIFNDPSGWGTAVKELVDFQPYQSMGQHDAKHKPLQMARRVAQAEDRPNGQVAHNGAQMYMNYFKETSISKDRSDSKSQSDLVPNECSIIQADKSLLRLHQPRNDDNAPIGTRFTTPKPNIDTKRIYFEQDIQNPLQQSAQILFVDVADAPQLKPLLPTPGDPNQSTQNRGSRTQRALRSTSPTTQTLNKGVTHGCLVKKIPTDQLFKEFGNDQSKRQKTE